MVHAHGAVHVLDDETFIRGVVARLKRTHEADQPKPWTMGAAPADFMAEQPSRIVGIEVRFTRLDGKRKPNQQHQQHQQPDQDGAIRGLQACDHHGLAQAMRDSAPPSG